MPFTVTRDPHITSLTCLSLSSPPQYASVEKEGQQYMTANDFVRHYLGLYDEPNYNPNSIQLLGGILDTSKDGLISFEEFHAFEGLLCVPDALYKTAFQLFDTKGTGMVSFGRHC